MITILKRRPNRIDHPLPPVGSRVFSAGAGRKSTPSPEAPWKPITHTYESEATMEKFIIDIAKSLVDKPEAVSVNTIRGSQVSVYELRVAKEDLGKVIGKKGRTASAMRTLLSALSAKLKNPSVLEIVE
jgi:uncharacterized protein